MTEAPYPHIEWLQESNMYDSFISRYDENSKFFVHAQPVFCRDSNQPGSVLAEAEKLGIDLPFDESFFKPCSDSEHYNINYFEMEAWKLNGNEWEGPFFYLSKPRGQGQNWGNNYAVFWDELNYQDEASTCYFDQCASDSCEEGYKCENTWNGQTAGFECIPDSGKMFIIE